MKKQFYTFLCCFWAWTANATTFNVDNLNDAGVGSLRQAILDANADASATIPLPHIISINIAGIINLGSTLPQLDNHITILGNAATVDGANSFRIFNMGNGLAITISDLTIQNGSDAIGGCIYNEAYLTLLRCTISGGDAVGQGGGIYHQFNDLVAIECDFLSNHAAGDGGAIYNESAVTLRDCNFMALNYANGSGGAIFSRLNALSISKCTFDGNRADGEGSAICMQGEATDMTNCTFTNNENAAAIMIRHTCIFASISHSTIASNEGIGLQIEASLDLVNTIVANNGVDILDGTFIGANQGNLVENCQTNCPAFAVTADPMLATLANNGGFTKTMALQTGSPAIDAATPTGLVDDQRGLTRGVLPDIGAYEFDPASLPIGLLNFALQRSSIDKVNLSWVTSSETNNKGFEIQRQWANQEGGFQTIHWIDGHGTTSETQFYTYTDTNSFVGTSYYRLKQINTTGGFSYSPLRAIEGKAIKNEMTLFPNPVSTDAYIRLDASLDGQSATIQIHAADGRLMSQTEVLIPTNQLLTIPNVQNLSAGTYTVQITLPSGIAYTRKFEKIPR